MPPYPMDLRKACGKTSSELIAAATVSAENITVRPAVAIVRTRACWVSSGVSAISSRKRDTTNSA